MDGNAVHAKCGDRSNYAPIRSALCASGNPHDVVDALLGLYPFKRLYIADINAIQGRDNHAGIIRGIQHNHPSLEIWLDAGISTGNLAAWQQQGLHCVIGSESISHMDKYRMLMQTPDHKNLLSLDFNQTGFLGPEPLLQDASNWPDRIIAMTLARVGSAAGPDTERLASIASRAGNRHVYAAGGIRGISDLLKLEASGITGALVATTLHTGSLTTGDIHSLMQAPLAKAE
ncbi:phosphoribosylformimino-5-aminoimidazole carboxamide ribotide isomerase [Methylophilaceae bacterium]|nr:phosphoribosylformimino-5-aminoimidazole carboxamide ribotide isomerase [Methylophilaceae bacterium]